jgi:hypothetical protein
VSCVFSPIISSNLRSKEKREEIRRVGKKGIETKIPLDELEKQVSMVINAIKKRPLMRRQVLTSFISNIFVAVKETLRGQGRVASLYMIVAEHAEFGVPPVTEEVIKMAKERKAEAVITIEGFHSDKDISDVVYHVSMSAPAIGVVGWVLKAKIRDRSLEFVRELPYLFNSVEKVKTLGQILEEMEGNGQGVGSKG